MKHTVFSIKTAILTALFLGLGSYGQAQPHFNVRVQRWLELKQIAGQVTYIQGITSRPARIGDLLQTVGDAIATGKRSTATLFVDTGVGVINVSENTKLLVQKLAFAADNGRITRLKVTQGQARLKVRPFTHQGSQLEIETPASLSGVRGTEFGITVQPNGKTGLAVRSGAVSSSAQGQTRSVNGGFQNFTIPGEAPSVPMPLKDDPGLTYTIDRVIEAGQRKFRIVGQVDPVNSVMVEDTPQVTDRDGRFTTRLLATPSAIEVTVITPLGTQKSHIVLIPYTHQSHLLEKA